MRVALVGKPNVELARTNADIELANEKGSPPRHERNGEGKPRRSVELQVPCTDQRARIGRHGAFPSRRCMTRSDDKHTDHGAAPRGVSDPAVQRRR